MVELVVDDIDILALAAQQAVAAGAAIERVVAAEPGERVRKRRAGDPVVLAVMVKFTDLPPRKL
jgi:hypothetical protein